MILMTVPIILIFNSVGLLAALLFYGFFLYRRLGKYIAFNLRSLAMLILLGFLAALVFKDPGGRYAIWMQTVKMALDHPIIGYGLGAFSNSVLMVEHTAAGNILWVHPHNEFLYVFFSAGFLGVFIFLLWLLELFMTLNLVRPINLSRTLPDTFFSCVLGLLAFLMTCMTQYSAHVAPIIMTALLFLSGIFIYAYQPHKEENTCLL